MGETNLPENIVRELVGPLQVNQSLNVTARQGFWNFQPDRPLSTQQEFDPYNVWYQRNGGVVDRPTSGLYRVQTDGSTDSEAILETADIGIYRPGTTATVSGGVWIDDTPTGDAFYEIGYEQDGDEERLDFLINSDDDLKFEWDSAQDTDGPFILTPTEFKEGAYTEVEDQGTKIAEVYGLNPRGGNGLDVRDWDGSRGYLYGMTLGWYGPTSVMPWVGEVADMNGMWVQRAWPLALIRPIHRPLITQPNRPFSVRAYSGTSGQSLTARIGGRQFATQGAVNLKPEPTFDYAQNQSLPTTGGYGEGNWHVIAVMRRKADNEGTALGMDRLDVVPDANDVRVLVRVIDAQYLSGVQYDEPTDTPARQTAIELDLETDTPDRVTVSERTVDGSTKLQGIGWTGGFANASTQGTGETNIGTGFDFPIVRDNPTIVLASPRVNQAATVDTSLEILEAG